jgi:hypothetical protein
MSKVTKVRASVKTASKPKVKGLVELYRTPEGNSWGILNLAIRGEATLYWLRRVSSDFGDGFELEKFSTFGSGAYRVYLSDEGHTCDCPTAVYRGRCKHSAALAALRDGGRI